LAFARLEASGNDAAVKAYYDEKSPPFPVVRDPRSDLARALGAMAFPSFVLIDKFGHVRYRGRLPAGEDLAEWAAALAAEETDPGPEAAMFGPGELDVAALLDATRLPDLAGATDPLADYRGRNGLLVVFVDTDCPFAGSATGDMPAVSRVLSQRGIAGVLVNVGDSAERVAESYKSRNTGTPVVYDPSKKTQNAWAVESVPTVVLIAPDNRIAYRGPAVWDDVAAAVAEMLELPAGLIDFSVKGSEYG